MRGAILGLSVTIWALCAFIIPMEIKRQGRETRKLVLELAHMQYAMKGRGMLHEYRVNLDNDLCVTNVVDDGRVVWP